MTTRYPGPLRDQPLPIELHNTLYATTRGDRCDGIADAAALRAWLAAVASDLPVPAPSIDADRSAAFRALRDAVRSALHAALDDKPVPPRARRTLNDTAAACPRSTQLAADGTRRVRYHAEDPTQIVLAAIAHETIALVTGPRARDLRLCGAPGCVLAFLKDHPRRAWCSPSCGNRARQARHYARHHH
ncbi:MAG: ABATE domain-containing protein [Solirubrobacteraceae bacterium]|nr:ABATE domain-containing protein [Solirubrobacteraceae bacterium]